MKIYICPDCGKNWKKEAPEACPQCGCPSNVFVESEIPDDEKPIMSALQSNLTGKLSNISPFLEESNNFNAEHAVNGLAIVSLGIGIGVGILGLIVGLWILSSSVFAGGMIAALVIIAGLLFCFLAIFFWAGLKLLVNISYRLTRLDNKSNLK